MSVRVRFAPSPTGYLHIGGLRTALYNFLFARHHGGTFVLRIEDTDKTRYVEGSVENIIEMLHWCGLDYDEGPGKGGPYGPYVQSERTEIYRRYAQELLDKGAAYIAFDTPEELERMRQRQQQAGIVPKYDRTTMRNQFTLGEEETQRLLAEGVPYVIRLKVPLTGVIKFSDIVRGEISVPARDVDDQILLKSDGFPTYHLANVVDDHLMHITHVIRGEEWLPSMPKHVLLYEAFGWEKPQFAHLPLLLNPDRSKLSKRHGHVAVEDFKKEGYFPEALINFVALLGWNPTGEREIYSLQELIELFDLKKVNKAGAIFDIQKLRWINAHYLRHKDPKELARQLQQYVQEGNLGDFSLEYLEKVVILLRERVDLLPEILTFGDYLFHPPTHFEQEYFARAWSDDIEALIPELLALLRQIEPWEHMVIWEQLKGFAKQQGTKIGKVMNALRLMLTGKSVGAGMTETMEVLGKEETLRRIEQFVTQHLPALRQQVAENASE